MPLQQTYAQVSLPARTGTAPGAETQILGSEDLNGAAHRLIEVGSPSAKPFNLLVEWSAAGGPSPRARVSVASGTRLCVYARSVRLFGSNMFNAANDVTAIVSDGGPIPTKNTYQIEFEGAVVNSDLEIAAFANRIRLEPAAMAAVATLDFYNGNGTLIATWPWASIPSDGVPLGATDIVRVNSTTACRVVYDLAL